MHHGHLIVAQSAVEQLALDHVRFVPTWRQPFKEAGHESSPEHRLAMLEAAVAGDPRLRVDPVEVNRRGTSFTVETLRSLAVVFPDDRLFLLVGADAARDLPLWKEAEAIGDLADVVALTRPRVAAPQDAYVDRWIPVPSIDISATDIRHRVKSGRSIRYLVPPSVREYIDANKLYLEGAECSKDS